MEALSLLEALSKIKSYPREEGELASFILGYLKSLGYNAFIEYSNILIMPDKDFIVATHMDTFRLLSPFSFDGEYVYGTGVCDAKASITAILLALKRIGFKGLNFGVALFCDEEGEGSGSRDFCRAYAPKMAIVMEPTDMTIANVQYGGLELRIKAKGVAAHGATPNMGENAIEKCIGILRDLMKINEAIVSIQYISGGNLEDFVIPEECEMRVELLFKPDVKVERLLMIVREVLSSQKNIEANIKEAYDGFISTKAFRLLEEAMSIVGHEVKFSEMPSWTDAVNLHNYAGCDTAIFGPGQLYLCHTKNERVKIKDIMLAADILVVLNDLLREASI